MKNHSFYLIPLKREDNNNDENLYGLNKYNYTLILETDPLNENDNYHMVFSITFPININIEINTDLIYKFESTRKFCLRDLIKESAGKQNNIEGRLYEYYSEVKIFQKIWIKTEKLLLFKNVDTYEKKNIFYLLTEFKGNDTDTKEYILMKKMNNDANKQFFQIIRVNIDDSINKDVDCLNENNLILEIGTEFSIQEGSYGDDFMLRDGIDYETFASDGSAVKSYIFKGTKNLVCLNYENNKYGNKCFSNINSNK